MKKDDSSQFELALKSALSHTIFPGRALLTVGEVADAWGATLKHVLNLVEVGDLTAVDLRSSKPVAKEDLEKMKEHKSVRRTLRIPVSAYDEFIRKNSTGADPK